MRGLAGLKLNDTFFIYFHTIKNNLAKINIDSIFHEERTLVLCLLLWEYELFFQTMYLDFSQSTLRNQITVHNLVCGALWRLIGWYRIVSTIRPAVLLQFFFSKYRLIFKVGLFLKKFPKSRHIFKVGCMVWCILENVKLHHCILKISVYIFSKSAYCRDYTVFQKKV